MDARSLQRAVPRAASVCLPKNGRFDVLAENAQLESGMTSFLTIKSRSDFLAARRSPSFSSPSFLLVRHSRSDDGEMRFGFTVTKKMGGAVVRNRIKRRLREGVHEALKSLRRRDFTTLAWTIY